MTWKCAVESCTKPTLFYNGDCRTCDGHYCGKHLVDSKIHPCAGLDNHGLMVAQSAKWREDKKEIFEQLDLDTIRRAACEARPGHTCTFPAQPWTSDTDYIAHGTNICLLLTFDDGVKWVVRMRQLAAPQSPPPEGAKQALMSEAATFKHLHDQGLTVPNVWLPSSTSQNETPYYFVDFVPGACHKPFNSPAGGEPSAETLVVIENIAKWYISLEKVSFDSVGSLAFDAETGSVVVGPIIDRVNLSNTAPYFLGPYKTAKDRYVTYFSMMMEQIQDGRRSKPGDELKDYLVALELKTLVEGCKELEEGPWYLKHADDRGDLFHFLDDGTISGVLDWDWAYTTCKAQAFAAPIGFITGSFFAGRNVLCPREKALVNAYEKLGRPDMAEHVRKGKKFQRLAFLLDGRQLDWMELVGIRNAFLGIPDRAPDQPTTMDEWIKASTERYQHDVGLKRILAAHSAKISAPAPLRTSIQLPLSTNTAWTCGVEGCPNPTLLHFGDCVYCEHHYCGTHFSNQESHTCARPMDSQEQIRVQGEYVRSSRLKLLERLDLVDIARMASDLRPGYTCTPPAELVNRETYIAHGTNICIPLTFSDGHKWMLRFRQQPGMYAPPPEGAKQALLSEAATFKHLHNQGALVPNAWLRPQPFKDDEIPYYFVDFIEGASHKPFNNPISDVPTPETLTAVESIAKWFITLAKVSFDRVGSLAFTANQAEVTIGPCIDQVNLSDAPPYFQGPFDTAMARYVSHYNTIMLQILQGRRAPKGRELELYLVALEIKTLVEGCAEMNVGPWYIKHAEDRGDHILFDEDGQITGVIDWDWAYTTCKAQAFAAPIAFIGDAFWDGNNELCPREIALVDAYERLGRPDLANLVRNGKKFQRLSFLLSGQEVDVVDLNGIRKAFLDLADDVEGLPTCMDEWIEASVERYSQDEGVKQILGDLKKVTAESD